MSKLSQPYEYVAHHMPLAALLAMIRQDQFQTDSNAMTLEDKEAIRKRWKRH